MNCKRCNEDYPSRYWFERDDICINCYKKLTREEKENLTRTDARIHKTKDSKCKVVGVCFFLSLISFLVLPLTSNHFWVLPIGSDYSLTGFELIYRDIICLILALVYFVGVLCYFLEKKKRVFKICLSGILAWYIAIFGLHCYAPPERTTLAWGYLISFITSMIARCILNGSMPGINTIF